MKTKNKLRAFHTRQKVRGKIIAIVGMCGSGKSLLADEFVKLGYKYIRFGQIVLDEVKRRDLKPTEANERPIREKLRKKHGMGALAALNLPKFDKALKTSNVIADGMYSWTEYKILKDYYKNRLTVIAVYAPPQIRYQRLKDRRKKYKKDPKLKYRSFSLKEARTRDFAEIENIEKGGPIAMADYTIINDGSLKKFSKQTKKIIKKING